jgi:hypothetical protein
MMPRELVTRSRLGRILIQGLVPMPVALAFGVATDDVAFSVLLAGGAGTIIVVASLLYWGLNAIYARHEGLEEVRFGRSYRIWPWDEISAAAWEEGGWGILVAAHSGGIRLSTDQEANVWDPEGAWLVGRIHPNFPRDRLSTANHVTCVLRRYLGDRVERRLVE